MVVMVGVTALALSWLIDPSRAWDGPRIWTAKRVLTLESDAPSTEAVGVEGGMIVAVGSLESVRAHFAGRDVTVDDRFANYVLVPGFIDPHIHPSLAATILPLEIVSAMEWVTPRGRTVAVRGPDEFLARLVELEQARVGEPNEWLIVWGYHAPHHGELTRATLDRVSSSRPILVWQRSVHEIYANTAALEAAGLTQEAMDAHPMADWDEGHLWEAGVFALGEPFMKQLTAPTSYLEGLGMMTQVLHRGGLTTVGEQGSPQMGGVAEWFALWFEMWRSDAPYRFVMVPNGMGLLREHGSGAAALAAAERFIPWSGERIRFARHIKLYADGAIFSQLMQMTQPYLDGHHGEWMMPPEAQREVLEAFWSAGWDVHVHVNGDAGLDFVLDAVAERQQEQPDPERLVVMEHYGFAREDQHERLAELGVEVSNNAYYVHELAPIYAQHGLGPERAAAISPLGGLARAGVAASYHSDFPMAPAEPLRLMEAAVTRVASDGQIWGPDERVSVERALRAVTIEAARHLGMEDEVGSIAVGKRADFTVLGADPTAVDPGGLAEIPIWGTVFEGRPFPLDH